MAAVPSLKHIQIDKANQMIVIVIAIAAFLVIFTGLSGKTLVSQLAYQNRVISAKQTALNQLKVDITANNQLLSSYKAFVNTSTNLIGGPTTGTASNDGDNAKIILDALPSQYDFPALTTSLQSLLSSDGVNISSIGGTDESATGGTSAATPTSTASVGATVPIPFEFSVDGPYANIQNVLKSFERSIRPFQILTTSLSGPQTDLNLTVSAQTFYQPQQNFNITTETVQ